MARLLVGLAFLISHVAAMVGRRMLGQTLNAEFSAKGIHVAHILRALSDRPWWNH